MKPVIRLNSDTPIENFNQQMYGAVFGGPKVPLLTNNIPSEKASPEQHPPQSNPSAQCPNPHTTSNQGLYTDRTQDMQFLANMEGAFARQNEHRIQDAMLDLQHQRKCSGLPPMNEHQARQEILQQMEQEYLRARGLDAYSIQDRKTQEKIAAEKAQKKTEQAAAKALGVEAPKSVEEKQPNIKEKHVEDLTAKFAETSLSEKQETAKADQKLKGADSNPSKAGGKLKDAAKAGLNAGKEKLKSNCKSEALIKNGGESLGEALIDAAFEANSLKDAGKIIAINTLKEGLITTIGEAVHEGAGTALKELGLKAVPGFEASKILAEVGYVAVTNGVTKETAVMIANEVVADGAIAAGSTVVAAATTAYAGPIALAGLTAVCPPAGAAAAFMSPVIAPVTTGALTGIYTRCGKFVKTCMVDSFSNWMWPEAANAGASATQATPVSCSASGFPHFRQVSSPATLSKTAAQWQQTFAEASNRFSPKELHRQFANPESGSLRGFYPDAAIAALFLGQSKA